MKISIACASTQGTPIHIKVLDGIRGLAILLVLMSHGFGAFTIQTRSEAIFKHVLASYGWMGVDLFFVLSGFLITGILLKTKHKANYFKNFYMRRVLRIFPLYYFIILVSFFILPKLGGWWTTAFRNGSTELPWFLSYLMNYLGTVTVPLGHFWSLCVEEQFYLLWPLLVWCLSYRMIIILCLIGLMTSPVLRWIVFSHGVTVGAINFYSATHADALLCGALLATVSHAKSGLLQYRRFATFFFVFSGIVVAGIYGLSILRLLPEALNVSLNFSFVAVFFAALLVMVVTAENSAWYIQVFDSSLLCWLGKYSYGIYVFNGPVYRFLAQHFGGEEYIMPIYMGSQIPFVVYFGILTAFLSCALAYLSYHVMEKHFLKLKRFF